MSKQEIIFLLIINHGFPFVLFSCIAFRNLFVCILLSISLFHIIRTYSHFFWSTCYINLRRLNFHVFHYFLSMKISLNIIISVVNTFGFIRPGLSILTRLNRIKQRVQQKTLKVTNTLLFILLKYQ